jgi:hypothetical protein
MSVSLFTWKNSARTGRIFVKYDIWVVVWKSIEKFEFYENRARITGTLRGGQRKFLIISLSILVRMRNVSEIKSCRKPKQFRVKQFFFRKLCPLWGNVKKYCRAGQATRKYSACALHGGYQILQTHKHNMWYCLSTGAVGCTNSPECYNIKMIKQLTSNTSYFIVCEATCFGPYVTIIKPSSFL